MLLITTTLLLLAYTALTFADVTVEKACPATALKLVGNKFFRVKDQQCFLFMNYDQVYYDSAKDKCNNSGGILAMPKTKEINDFLKQEMKTYFGNKPMWIGMNDKDKEGKMVWEDGTDVKDWGNNFDWGNGGAFGKEENCIALDPKNTKWHDFPCNDEGVGRLFAKKMGFVCEYPILPDNVDMSHDNDNAAGQGDNTGNADAGQGDNTGNADAGQGDNNSTADAVQGDNNSTADAGQVDNADGIEDKVEVDDCPPFDCNDKDCGMSGYIHENGCQICECNEYPLDDAQNVTSINNSTLF